ncbi:MAG: alpha amylase C-terminal domain-containing protein [Acidobacteriia bacterium]|nr:alpha amylase C-terminal domain-containing protein [Terriglobia bacterium]
MATARLPRGAFPAQQGVSFRAWAPFASQVYVEGDFNSWSKTATALNSEGNGYWSTIVPNAQLGDEYKFVVVNRDTGEVLEKNDTYAREVTNSAGNSVVADPDFSWTATDFVTPPWNEMVVYEIHVGSFTVDQSTPIKRGTFRSLATKLPYLRDLGINAIEVMPSGEFPTDVSLGYNVAYPFAIESSYGGPNGFRQLIDAAHQYGIAVILDVVYNHFGPSDLDGGLRRFDGWSENNGDGIYFYNDWRYVTEWGPRPDYGRPEVRQYIQENAQRWCDTRYVDGLRWDATNTIRNVYAKNNDPDHDLADGWKLMQEINDSLAAQPLWNMKISIAEDMKDNEWLTKHTRDGGAGFDSQWDASFVHSVRQSVITPRDEDRDMNSIANALMHRYNWDVFERVIYSESHDEVMNGRARVPEDIWPGNAGSWYSKKRSTLAATLVFTAPAIPMIFQGQEFLEDGWFQDSKALDWSKEWKHAGILNLYRDLIHLRRNWFDNTRGLRSQSINVFHINNSDKLIAFHRWGNGGPHDDVIVVANFANRSYDCYNLGLPREGSWRVRFNSDWSGYSADFGNHPSYDIMAHAGSKDGLPFNGCVSIGPYTAVILSQD